MAEIKRTLGPDTLYHTQRFVAAQATNNRFRQGARKESSDEH